MCGPQLCERASYVIGRRAGRASACRGSVRWGPCAPSARANVHWGESGACETAAYEELGHSVETQTEGSEGERERKRQR